MMTSCPTWTQHSGSRFCSGGTLFRIRNTVDISDGLRQYNNSVTTQYLILLRFGHILNILRTDYKYYNSISSTSVHCRHSTSRSDTYLSNIIKGRYIHTYYIYLFEFNQMYDVIYR